LFNRPKPTAGCSANGRRRMRMRRRRRRRRRKRRRRRRRRIDKGSHYAFELQHLPTSLLLALRTL